MMNTATTEGPDTIGAYAETSEELNIPASVDTPLKDISNEQA